MGIRFRCHHCEHELNLKEFQAGRRAKCPACSGRFRVPTSSAEFSQPLDDQEVQLATSHAAATRVAASAGTFDLRPSSADPDIVAVRSVATSHNEPSQTREVVVPKAIKEAPQAIWYVRPPSGGQYGPAEGTLFNNWLQDNRVSADSFVWRDGWPQWQLAGDVFVEYFGADWRIVQASADSGASGLSEEAIASPAGNRENAAPASPTPPVSSIAVSRRKKRQSTYGIIIAVLAILAIALIAVLVSVVF